MSRNWTDTTQSPSFNSSTDSSAELAAVVDDLLNQLNTKFTNISSDLLSKSKSFSPAYNLQMLMLGSG